MRIFGFEIITREKYERLCLAQATEFMLRDRVAEWEDWECSWSDDDYAWTWTFRADGRQVSPKSMRLHGSAPDTDPCQSRWESCGVPLP